METQIMLNTKKFEEDANEHFSQYNNTPWCHYDYSNDEELEESTENDSDDEE